MAEEKSTDLELLQITKDILTYCLKEEPADLSFLSGQRCSDKVVQQCSIVAVII